MRTVRADGYDVPLDALLAALHNRSHPAGMGLLNARGPLSRAEARVIAEKLGDAPFAVDYFFGRPIKVVERSGAVDGRLYDRDNGVGAFAEAVLDAITMPEIK